MALDQVVDGQPLPALVYNNLSAAVDGHETRILALETARQAGTSTGTIVTGQNSVSVAVTFPTAFVAAPSAFTATYDSSLGGTVGNFGCRLSALSATGATVVVYRTDGTTSPGNQTVTFRWVAFV